jgi:mannose-6-phosphate isomerase-like protein (cupin superfamily)
MRVTPLFAPGEGNRYQQSRHTAVDEAELAPGDVLPLQGFPEERLYYFTDGRGLMDIYPGDQYEIRQNTALWTTPLIPTELRNVGQRPLYFTIFRVGDVPIPELENGLLSWTAVDGSGSAAPGSGQNTVQLYETHRHEEGLHLRIHLIPLRRSQRTHDPTEVLTLLPGTATQRHTHPDIEETIYVLAGSGIAHWDAEQLEIGPGTALCYPRDVIRYVENTGDCPLSYLCHSAALD